MPTILKGTLNLALKFIRKNAETLDMSVKEKQWFVYNHETVTGPFTSEEIASFIDQHQFRPDDLIWCKGYREWIPLESWKMPQQAQAEPQWYITEHGNTQGPMLFSEIVERIKVGAYSKHAKLWMPDMQNWASVYQIPTLMEELNICRRRYFRAPLAGTIEVTNLGGDAADTLTVSLGGLGIRNLKNVSVGQELNLRIVSPSLNGTIYAKAKVVYTSGRDAGLEFIHISDENKVAVFEYVQKFELATMDIDNSDTDPGIAA